MAAPTHLIETRAPKRAQISRVPRRRHRGHPISQDGETLAARSPCGDLREIAVDALPRGLLLGCQSPGDDAEDAADAVRGPPTPAGDLEPGKPARRERRGVLLPSWRAAGRWKPPPPGHGRGVGRVTGGSCARFPDPRRIDLWLRSMVGGRRVTDGGGHHGVPHPIGRRGEGADRPTIPGTRPSLRRESREGLPCRLACMRSMAGRISSWIGPRCSSAAIPGAMPGSIR